MGRFDVRRQAGLVDRKTVVLAGNDDPLITEVLHRVVRAVVSEFHLGGFCAGGQAQQLVTEADAEGRQPGIDNLPDRLDGIVTGLRITRSIGQKHAIGLHGQYFGCFGGGWNHGHPAAVPVRLASRDQGIDGHPRLQTDLAHLDRQLERIAEKAGEVAPALDALLDELGQRDDFFVIVGGGPVTAKYAESIGANGWAKSAAGVVLATVVAVC